MELFAATPYSYSANVAEQLKKGIYVIKRGGVVMVIICLAGTSATTCREIG
jgi:ribosomal protein L36